MAYVTTETGVVTMSLMLVLGGWLLARRPADFEKLRPARAHAPWQPGPV